MIAKLKWTQNNAQQNIEHLHYPIQHRINNNIKHFIGVRGEVLPTPHGTTTAVADLSNLGKTDLSEI